MIKITVDEVKRICNLHDIDRVEILESKFVITNALLKGVVRKRYYMQVVKENADELVKSAFYTGFSYFLYAECIELLNTNTAGSGIIASTGYADSRIELLSTEESFQKRNNLEYKAYTVLKDYLNEAGLKRYKELKLWDDMRRAGDSEAKQRLLNTSNRRLRGAII